MRGHPVFIAQHATAPCCRECIRKWYKMQLGKKLSQVQRDYLVEIIVDNIDVSIDFYEELFGLRVITRQEGNQKMSISANRNEKL